MFGCIVAGRLVQTNLQQVEVNKYLFELSDPSSINHIVVFMLGTIPFDNNHGASVHFLWPNKNWQFLGCLTNEKPSSIYKLRSQDMVDNGSGLSVVSLGISIEPLVLLEQQMAQHNTTLSIMKLETTTLPIVQNILTNLYNFITSFVSSSNDTSLSNTLIPLSAFQQWHDKLLNKLKLDP
ncbi:DUF775-domain-containing protein, partial [Neoconidiobolus thromboides FSU 785]